MITLVARATGQEMAGDSRHRQETVGKRAHQRGSHVSLTLALPDCTDSLIDMTKINRVNLT
jgi:hypothetical protein